MPPLTLAILASVLHMQGADATLTSDNKGIEDLLATVRGQLQEQVNPNTSLILEARKNHTKGTYYKTYTKLFGKDYGGPAAKSGHGTAPKPGGNRMHR